MSDVDVTVVVATRDRRDRLLGTLERLSRLPEAPPVVVVDNNSSDRTPEAVECAFPEVEVIALAENRGAAARTAGVQAARTEGVAFCDDDSWWAPGSLTRAAEHLATFPRLGLIAARVLVGPDGRVDPVSAQMERSPLACPRPLPGPAVLGFVACGAVVRRRSYLHVGGFSELLFFLGEERLLAFDLAAAGWDLAYAPDVVAHHHPAGQKTDSHHQALILRNDLLTDWMRRPLRVALRNSWALARRARNDPAARLAVSDALRSAPLALAGRRRLPRHVERRFRRL